MESVSEVLSGTSIHVCYNEATISKLPSRYRSLAEIERIFGVEVHSSCPRDYHSKIFVIHKVMSQLGSGTASSIQRYDIQNMRTYMR